MNCRPILSLGKQQQLVFTGRASWEGAGNIFHMAISATDHLTFLMHKLELANYRVAYNITSLFLDVMVPAYLTAQPGWMTQLLHDRLIT